MDRANNSDYHGGHDARAASRAFVQVAVGVDGVHVAGGGASVGGYWTAAGCVRCVSADGCGCQIPFAVVSTRRGCWILVPSVGGLGMSGGDEMKCAPSSLGLPCRRALAVAIFHARIHCSDREAMMILNLLVIILEESQ